jgi:pantoate--beta-alanine ligase
MSPISPPKLQLVTTVEEVRSAVEAVRAAGGTVGLVPTMGALHEGHLSLVDASQAECDRTVVSIFVNPTQFGPREDLARYPRDLERDLQLLEARGCWLVFAPNVEEVYPPGHQTFVEVGAVAEPWEGACRPGHFRGVATVVLKLFQMVGAQRAYFGRKDYQQALVVRQMASDFNLPTEICVCSIIREADGLALSSRNAYLSPDQRQRATSLWRSLQLAASLILGGETDAETISERMRECLQAGGVTSIEYIALVEAGTVQPVSKITGPVVAMVAARVGQTRLIDNHTLALPTK